MPAGRPTDYRPEFAEEIVQLMDEGLSLTAASAELGFWRQRAYEWAVKHPEFADAIKFGQARRTLKLERDLLGSGDGPFVTSRIFALKNAAPDEWRDRVVNEHSGPDGGPIQTEDVSARDRIARKLSSIAARSGAAGDPGGAE